jgi:hypothetical protein
VLWVNGFFFINKVTNSILLPLKNFTLAWFSAIGGFRQTLKLILYLKVRYYIDTFDLSNLQLTLSHETLAAGVRPVITEMNYKILIWLSFFLTELILFFLFRYLQPLCEPCLPGTYCPPCISSRQINVFWFGALIALIFIIWQIVSFWKKKKNP